MMPQPLDVVTFRELKQDGKGIHIDRSDGYQVRQIEETII
jgi:biotin operon repressor